MVLSFTNVCRIFRSNNNIVTQRFLRTSVFLYVRDSVFDPLQESMSHTAVHFLNRNAFSIGMQSFIETLIVASEGISFSSETPLFHHMNINFYRNTFHFIRRKFVFFGNTAVSSQGIPIFIETLIIFIRRNIVFFGNTAISSQGY